MRATTYRNNSRVFVFGAGVSRAVAGAPVMKELFLKMKQRYEQEKKLPDPFVRNSRIDEFKSIEAVINKLEGRTKKGLSESKGGEGIKIKDDTGIRENIEWLITLIDLTTDYAPKFGFKAKPGVDVRPFAVNPFKGMSRMEMERARRYLNRYLYLCLCDLKDEKDILSKFFKEQQLRRNDYLITFNYDVLIENALLEIGKWSPVGGYFGVNQFRSAYKNIDKIFPENSPCKILKLHGSINWVKEGVLPDINNPPVITFHKWDSSPFFPKYEKILGEKPSGNSPTWILPSYFKTFSRNSFIFAIWREAQKIFAHARRLVVLGYSFPEEDSPSQLLLASLPDDCSILIVNPEGDAIKKRMNNILRSPDISPDISVQKVGFEKWDKVTLDLNNWEANQFKSNLRKGKA